MASAVATLRAGLLALGLATIALPPGTSAQASRGALTRGTFAITDVSVIPMTSDTVFAGATVLVRDGRIVAVGPSASVRVPGGARRIDGRGKFLIPGLADMHVHLFSDGDAPDSVARYELGVMVANGVTATRMMMGTPEQLALKREVIAGRVIGPQLWLASPEFAGRRYGGAGFKGHAVATPEEARAAVREIADAGYDFVKITLFVGRPAYDVIVAEAKARGVGVVGHVDPQVGVPHALGSGQHIEHFDNYMEHVLADSAPTKESVSDRGVFRPSAWQSLDHVDDAKVDRIAGLTARSGTYTTPTLTIFKKAFALGVPDDEIRSWPDWTMYSPELRKGWLAARDRYWANPASEARRRRWVETRNRLTKAIHDSGGRIMAGSDTPEWFFSYGWSLHRELESLVTAGLTPYAALAAATRTPAEFVGASSEWGTITTGKRADLVLLSANPLQDIRNTTRIEAVSVGGRWLPRTELDRMIKLAMERVGGTGDR